MKHSRSENESVVVFFALTFLISTPFYILNALAYMNIAGEPEMGAIYIALFTLAPIISASILTYQRRGRQGLKELLGRVVDYKRIPGSRWYLVIIFLSPLIFLLSLAGVALFNTAIPPALTPLVALPAVFPFLFLLATGEELGWMGYAFGPMQARNGALRAAFVLGLIWAFWHLPFFVFMMPDPFVLTTQVLTLVGPRVLVAWIFNNTGRSVFAAILFHAVDNTALVAFPDINAIIPWGSALPCALVMVTAIMVTSLWGPRSLAQYRFKKRESDPT